MPHSNIFAAAAVLHRPAPSAHSDLADPDLPGIARGDGDGAPRPWPFNPDDVSPLGWWRTLPADQLGEAQQKMLRAAIAKICVRERQWLAGVPEDAASSIALALGTLPLTAITLEVDLAMSALAISALGGNAGSVLVLSHILRLAPLDHPFARELSAAWLRLTPQRALDVKARAPHRVAANRCPVDDQAACQTGDNA